MMLNQKQNSNEDLDKVDSSDLDYDIITKQGELAIKVICLGDSAVGKSKLLERYLVDGFEHHQLSTYALTLHRHRTSLNGSPILVENEEVAGRTFAFAEKNNMNLYYVSAAKGTNVVKLFNDAIAAAYKYKINPTDFVDQVLDELDIEEDD